MGVALCSLESLFLCDQQIFFTMFLLTAALLNLGLVTLTTALPPPTEVATESVDTRVVNREPQQQQEVQKNIAGSLVQDVKQINVLLNIPNNCNADGPPLPQRVSGFPFQAFAVPVKGLMHSHGADEHPGFANISETPARRKIPINAAAIVAFIFLALMFLSLDELTGFGSH